MKYENVRHFPGGMAEWTESGGVVETAAAKQEVTEEPPSKPPSPGPRVRPAIATPRWPARMRGAIEQSSFTKILWVYLGMVTAFGIAFWLAGLAAPALLEHGRPVEPSLPGFLTALYYSFVTATSIGYGDVVPIGPVRILAIAEGIGGLLLFGWAVSKLVSGRQEQLLEETHRLAFETRLGRVSTNLHLVLADLQEVSTNGRDEPVEHLLPRVESASMVFAGEMRAVHDLLYRPQQVPEERVLEAILASLATGLRELSALLERLPVGNAKPETLKLHLRTIRGLAMEICGECVPRDYAPALKTWMDRIQELAGRIGPA